MPKRRNSFWSRNKKEKQIVTTRLIEISLKVDDHIYKHKPVSECEAKQYMREVSSYKAQCSRDERSLQVIEKLTRCMRAIISDHQELRADVGSENNGSSMQYGDVRAGSTSPVYSISEEDRTQLTEVPEELARSVTKGNNDVEIIDLSNIDDDLINNDNTAEDYGGTRINVEVDIHRAISSLSLRDVEDPLEITLTDVNCSQSILNNFEDVERMHQNKANITFQGAVTCGLVVNVTDKDKTINVLQADKNIVCNNAIDKLQSQKQNEKAAHIIDPNKTVTQKTKNSPNKTKYIFTNSSNLINNTVVYKEPTKVISTTNNNLTNTYQKENTTSSHTFSSTTNNIPESQKQTWYESNRTCTINNSSHTLKAACNLTQPIQIYKVPNKTNQITAKDVSHSKQDIPRNTFNESQNGRHANNAIETVKAPYNNDIPISNTANIQENLTAKKKKRAPRKKKTVDVNEKEIKPKNRRVAPKRDKENTFTNLEKNKCVPIYNRNVINDLSWIENIRYVREIRVDENVAELNLEDSFWYNYYLPNNWNDNEFV